MKKKILYGRGSDFNLVFFSFLSYVERKYNKIYLINFRDSAKEIKVNKIY